MPPEEQEDTKKKALQDPLGLFHRNELEFRVVLMREVVAIG